MEGGIPVGEVQICDFHYQDGRIARQHDGWLNKQKATKLVTTEYWVLFSAEHSSKIFKFFLHSSFNTCLVLR